MPCIAHILRKKYLKYSQYIPTKSLYLIQVSNERLKNTYNKKKKKKNTTIR